MKVLGNPYWGLIIYGIIYFFMLNHHWIKCAHASLPDYEDTDSNAPRYSLTDSPVPTIGRLDEHKQFLTRKQKYKDPSCTLSVSLRNKRVKTDNQQDIATIWKEAINTTNFDTLKRLLRNNTEALTRGFGELDDRKNKDDDEVHTPLGYALDIGNVEVVQFFANSIRIASNHKAARFGILYLYGIGNLTPQHSACLYALYPRIMQQWKDGIDKNDIHGLTTLFQKDPQSFKRRFNGLDANVCITGEEYYPFSYALMQGTQTCMDFFIDSLTQQKEATELRAGIFLLAGQPTLTIPQTNALKKMAHAYRELVPTSDEHTQFQEWASRWEKGTVR